MGELPHVSSGLKAALLVDPVDDFTVWRVSTDGIAQKLANQIGRAHV